MEGKGKERKEEVLSGVDGRRTWQHSQKARMRAKNNTRVSINKVAKTESDARE